MTTRSSSNLQVLFVAALIVALPLAMYAGAYLGLTSGTSRNLTSGGTCRVYRSRWQAMLFLPASVVESALTGRDVCPAWRESGS